MSSLWNPNSLPQFSAYFSPADELYYGGAAGGGKSDLLIGLATTAHRKSVIFRREYPQLKDLIARSHEILDSTSATFNGQDNLWKGITGGRRLEFGALQLERDKEKYKGRPHDLKAWDEVSDFSESQYLFVNAWNRTAIPGQRCRVLAAGNPPTSAEGEWVIRRWRPWLDPQYSNPAQPGELRWFAMIDSRDVEVTSAHPIVYKDEVIQPKSRTFIPAKWFDNPAMVATGYGATLQNLPEPLRSILLNGDFQATRSDDPWQLIPTAWVKAAQARWTEERPDIPLTQVGSDIARGGDDETTIARRYGTWYAPILAYPGKMTPTGPASATLIVQACGGEVAMVNVDVIGVGSSVYDTLDDSGVPVTPVNFAERTDEIDKTGKLKFRNVRAAAWWRMREALDPISGDNLALPPDLRILADLTAPRWKLSISGIQVEDKDEIRERLGRSPDYGDAVVLASYIKPESGWSAWAKQQLQQMDQTKEGEDERER